MENMIAEFDVTEAVIAEIEQYKNLEITDTKSEKNVKKCRQVVRGLRTDIEKRRKELKTPVLERGKLIDWTAKDLTTRIQPTEENLSGKIKVVEVEKEKVRAEKADIERQRTEKIVAMLDNLTAMANTGIQYSQNAVAIQTALNDLETFEITEGIYQEHTEEAFKIRADGIKNTQLALEARLKFDGEQAALEAERERLEVEAEKQRAEREVAEAETKARRESEEAKQKAERNKLEAEKEAFRQKKEAEEKHEKAKAEAEAEAKAAEEKLLAQIEQDKKLAQLAAEQYKIDLDEAIQDNVLFDQARDVEIENDREWAKLIENDRKMLSILIGNIELPKFDDTLLQTDAGLAVFNRFLSDFGTMKNDLEANIKELT